VSLEHSVAAMQAHFVLLVQEDTSQSIEVLVVSLAATVHILCLRVAHVRCAQLDTSTIILVHHNVSPVILENTKNLLEHRIA
jgi:hypothetical protein